jgi:hypothetical protein
MAAISLNHFHTARGYQLLYWQSIFGGLKSCLSTWKSAKSRLAGSPKGFHELSRGSAKRPEGQPREPDDQEPLYDLTGTI